MLWKSFPSAVVDMFLKVRILLPLQLANDSDVVSGGFVVGLSRLFIVYGLTSDFLSLAGRG